MKEDPAGLKKAFELTGNDLNGRLDEQMLFIERVSVLLEDAKLDLNDVLALDDAGRDRLMEILSAYDAFLDHFRNTTEDTVAAIKGLTTVSENRCCNLESDTDIDGYDED